MDPESRRAWTEIVTPEDYDRHMETIGQAGASADLVAQFLSWTHLPGGSNVVIVGAGTGWMLDHSDLASLRELRLTFTDLSPRFLNKLRERVGAHRLTADVLEDDIEATKLPSGMDLLIASLVLEHIDWMRGAASITGLSPRFIGVVLQENPPGMTTSITPGRPLPPSISEASKIALSHLVPKGEIVAEFERLGYPCDRETSRVVADGKRLIGYLFGRGPRLRPRTVKKGPTSMFL
ncbi:MAG TPA: class I SAM-dependent methyltransferase [Thermoplasmata archaeon]|nr:class I SAM-dependent methyltransferase [Thermoplasmata archaeon]